MPQQYNRYVQKQIEEHNKSIQPATPKSLERYKKDSLFSNLIGKAKQYGYDFLMGASYRAVDNISFGAWNNINPNGDPQYQSKSYQAGAVFSDILTTIEGLITTGISVSVGVTVTVGSGGTAGFVAVPVASAAALYGAGLSTRSAAHLGEDLGVLFSKNSGSANTGKNGTLPKSKGKGETSKGWKVGDNVYKPTSKGKEPAWNTVKSRFWKNEAANPDAVKKYGAENVARMKKGNAPQRYNPDKGGMESMELSHEPIPKRDGGKDFVPRWPQDHAKVDPFRRPGY